VLESAAADLQSLAVVGGARQEEVLSGQHALPEQLLLHEGPHERAPPSIRFREDEHHAKGRPDHLGCDVEVAAYLMDHFPEPIAETPDLCRQVLLAVEAQSLAGRRERIDLALE